jgi:hypothetical protein
MCASTRFSIAIPLRNIKANSIIKVLTIQFLLLWVFLKQLRQMKIQFYVSFISASFELMTNHGPRSQLLSCILPVPLSGRLLYIHLAQSHLAVAIFLSMLSLS